MVNRLSQVFEKKGIVLKRSIPFTLLLFFTPIIFAQTVNVGQLLKEGKEARLQQNFELARVKLERAAKLAPDDSDVQVQLGFAYLFLNELTKADATFHKALELAPDYLDAKYGLALVRFREGSLIEAEQYVDEVVAKQSDYEAAIALQKNIKNAQRDQRLANRKWRLDIAGEYSGVSSGMDDWREGHLAISYKATPRTTVIAHSQIAKRFGETDKRFDLTLAHTFNDRFAGYGIVGATPNAKILAKYTVGIGGSFVINKGTKYLDTSVITLDVKHDEYRDGGVRTITPGIDQYFFAGRVMLSARSINIYQEHGGYSGGYMFRTNYDVTEKWHLFAGYSKALEPSDNRMIRTEASFTGVAYDLTDDLTIRLNYTHEHRREAYTRDIFGVGLTWLH